jgi:hypothetical protein
MKVGTITPERHLAVFAGIPFDPYEIDVLYISKG